MVNAIKIWTGVGAFVLTGAASAAILFQTPLQSADASEHHAFISDASAMLVAQGGEGGEQGSDTPKAAYQQSIQSLMDQKLTPIETAVKQKNTTNARSAYDAYALAWAPLEGKTKVGDKPLYVRIEAAASELGDKLRESQPDFAAATQNLSELRTLFQEAKTKVGDEARPELAPMSDGELKARAQDIISDELAKIDALAQNGNYDQAIFEFKRLDPAWDAIEEHVHKRSVPIYSRGETAVYNTEWVLYTTSRSPQTVKVATNQMRQVLQELMASLK